MSLTPPAPDRVVTMLKDLLGRPVGMKKVDPQRSEAASYALYSLEGGEVDALCMCDPALSAYLAAALTLHPPNGLPAIIKTKALPELLLENLREIYNVAMVIFHTEKAPRVLLRGMQGPGLPPPKEAQALLAKPRPRRIDLELDVKGYGSGRMAVVCA